MTDFVQYLIKRQDIIISPNLLFAAGEEDLLAYYLQHANAAQEHDFTRPDGKPLRKKDMLCIERGTYEHYTSHIQYMMKKEADQVSFFWDRLILLFTEHVLAGTSVAVFGMAPNASQSERALRIMAMENRVVRRALSRAFMGALEEAARRKVERFSRVVTPGPMSYNRDIAYVFLIMLYPSHLQLPGGYEQYRRARAATLEAYCSTVLLENKTIKTVVGIAVDGLPEITGRKESSEDLIAMERPEWNEEIIKEFTELKMKFNVLDPVRIERHHFRTNEYPSLSSDPDHPPPSRQQRRARERAQRKAERSLRKRN